MHLPSYGPSPSTIFSTVNYARQLFVSKEASNSLFAMQREVSYNFDIPIFYCKIYWNCLLLDDQLIY